MLRSQLNFVAARMDPDGAEALVNLQKSGCGPLNYFFIRQ